MGRDGPEPKEGVDFRWVKAENSNALVRDFNFKKSSTSVSATSETKVKAKAKVKSKPVAKSSLSGASRSTDGKVKKPSALSGASRSTAGKVKAKSVGGGASGSWSPPKVKGHKGVPWPPSMKGYAK